MKQNYNQPLFVFDATGVESENIESAFIEQFKKEYPTSKEAVQFAMADGLVLNKEVNSDGNVVFVFYLYNLTTLTIQSEGTTDLGFIGPSSAGFTVTYNGEGGGEGGGGGLI